MSEPFDGLAALADLDTELVALERSRSSLPARRALATLGESLAEIERARELLEPERAPLVVALEALEVEVSQLAERTAQVEARLSSATGAARELEAMHVEVGHLADRLSALEDQELELLESLEPLEQRLIELAAEAAPLLAERSSLEAALVGEEAALDEQLLEHHAARRAAAEHLEPGLLARYELAASRVGVPGAARLEHGSCTGCHLALPAAELDRLRHLDAAELSSCEQCDRILLRPNQLGG